MSFQITPTSHSFLTYSLSHHSSTPIYPFDNVIHYLLKNYLSSTDWMKDSGSSRSFIFCFKLILPALWKTSSQKWMWTLEGAYSQQFSLPRNTSGHRAFDLLYFPPCCHQNIRNSIGVGWTLLPGEALENFSLTTLTKHVLSSEMHQT